MHAGAHRHHLRNSNAPNPRDIQTDRQMPHTTRHTTPHHYAHKHHTDHRAIWQSAVFTQASPRDCPSYKCARDLAPHRDIIIRARTLPLMRGREDAAVHTKLSCERPSAQKELTSATRTATSERDRTLPSQSPSITMNTIHRGFFFGRGFHLRLTEKGFVAALLPLLPHPLRFSVQSRTAPCRL
jgi:hypothetical protein